MQGQNTEHIDHGEGIGALGLLQRNRGGMRVRMFEPFGLNLCRGQCLKEIAELNGFVAVILNVHTLSRGQDSPLPVEFHRVKPMLMSVINVPSIKTRSADSTYFRTCSSLLIAPP